MTAKVRYELSRTISTGSYKSAKVQVGLEMECEQTREEIEETYCRCKAFVDRRIAEEEIKWRL